MWGWARRRSFVALLLRMTANGGAAMACEFSSPSSGIGCFYFVKTCIAHIIDLPYLFAVWPAENSSRRQS